MYYNRTISKNFSELIEDGGKLRWLFDYVNERDELDFLIGKNNNSEWISIYRGLSRILTIKQSRKQSEIKIDAADSYKKLTADIYGVKSLSHNFKSDLDKLLSIVGKDKKFDRYYNNRKEGFYQNELSRKFGICGSQSDDFVIIDKEAVVGYADTAEKNKIYGVIRKGYKELQTTISNKDAKRYGKDLAEKSIGNELDFIALDKEGNILLIEYKHGNNTSGIYLSPLQIGMYYDLFTALPIEKLQQAVYEMLEQKKKIGLINPNWKNPKIKNVIPVLIISDYNYKSTAKVKYQEILEFVKLSKGNGFLKEIRTYNYTSQNGLTPW